MVALEAPSKLLEDGNLRFEDQLPKAGEAGQFGLDWLSKASFP